MDERRCLATRRDGTPCRAAATHGDYCWAHAPGLDEARQAARAKGGQGKATAARAERLVLAILRPVLDGLVEVFGEVKAGTRDPKVATALASVASAIVKVYGAGTMEERLTDIERALQDA